MKRSGSNSCAPLIIRLCVGLVFVWAGLGKVMATFPVQGETAAKLANMGVFIPVKVTRPGDSGAPAGTAPATTDREPKQSVQRSSTAFRVVPAAYALPSNGQGFTAEQFPDPVEVPRVYMLALDLDAKGNELNPVDTKGNPSFRLWPKALSTGIWPLAAAWTCTVAEIACGTFILVGLLTRLSGFILFFNMLVAAWLTVIGPALQSGNTQLGFLPNYPAFGEQWQLFLVQFLCICTTLSLVFSGAGCLSIDQALFGGPTGSRPVEKPAKEE